MRLLVLLAFVLTLVAYGFPALGQPLAPIEREVAQLEVSQAQLLGRRVRLEKESQELSQEIDRQKAAPAGVRRDLRLQELLAAAKTKADELTRLAAEVRWRVGPLEAARRKLIAACDRELKGNLSEARRLEL